jgi:hypothetical protein
MIACMTTALYPVLVPELHYSVIRHMYFVRSRLMPQASLGLVTPLRARPRRVWAEAHAPIRKATGVITQMHGR